MNQEKPKNKSKEVRESINDKERFIKIHNKYFINGHGILTSNIKSNKTRMALKALNEYKDLLPLTTIPSYTGGFFTTLVTRVVKNKWIGEDLISLQLKDELFITFQESIHSGLIRNWKTREIANILWAFAKINLRIEEREKASIVLVLKEKVDELNPIDIEHILWAWASMDLGLNNNGFVDFLARATEDRIDQFRGQEFSMILWSFAKLGYLITPSLFGKIEMILVSGRLVMNAQDLSIIIWSLVKMEIRFSNELMAVLLSEFDKKLDSFNVKDLCTTLWSLCKHSVVISQSFWIKIEDRLKKVLYLAKAQDLVNFIWVFSKIDISIQQQTMDLMQEKCLRELEHFNGIDLCNTAIALSRRKWEINKDFQLKIFLRIKNELYLICNYYLIQVFLSISNIKQDDTKLYFILKAEILKRLERFENIEFESFLNTIAKNPDDHDESIQGIIIKEIEQRSEKFDSRQISSILMSFIKIYPDCDRLVFLALESSIRLNFQYFNSQDLTTILWCYAKKSDYADEFMIRQIQKRLSDLTEEFSIEDYSSIIWSLAKIGRWIDWALIETLCSGIKKQSDDFGLKEIANIYWGLSRLEYFFNFKEIFSSKIYAQTNEMADDQKAKILQSYLINDDINDLTHGISLINSITKGTEIDESLIIIAYLYTLKNEKKGINFHLSDYKIENKRKGTFRISLVQKNLYDGLKKDYKGIRIEERLNGLIPCDLYYETERKKIVIEIDGPFHEVCGKRDPYDRLRDLLLEQKLGYQVKRFSALEENLEEKIRRYLNEEIKVAKEPRELSSIIRKLNFNAQPFIPSKSH